MNPRAKGKIELETAKMEAAFIAAFKAGESPQEMLDYLTFIATHQTGYRPPATANAGNACADKCGKRYVVTIEEETGEDDEPSESFSEPLVDASRETGARR
jgi:hypothetical protein